MELIDIALDHVEQAGGTINMPCTQGTVEDMIDRVLRRATERGLLVEVRRTAKTVHISLPEAEPFADLQAFAREHGVPALLDHLGLDDLGNEVIAGQKALNAARSKPSARVGPPQPARVLRAAQRTESFPELSPGDYGLREGPWFEWGAARDVRWERYAEPRYGAIGEIVMIPGNRFVTPLAEYYAMAVGTKQGDRVNWLVCPRVKLDKLIAERAIPDDGTMTFLVMEEPKSNYEDPR